MNSPLLGLTSAMSSPANASAGTVETESGPSGLFGEMLLQMTGASAEVPSEADAALAQTDVTAEQLEETPVDLLAALVASLAGTDQTDTEQDELSESEATNKDDSQASDDETDAASLAAVAIALPAITAPANVVADTGTTEAPALPASGKSLPTPLLLLNQPAQAESPLMTSTDEGAASELTEPADVWTQLFEVAGKGIEFKATADAAAPVSRQTSVEPLLTISSLAGPAAAAGTMRTASADAVAGIPVRSANFANLVGNEVLWQAKIGNNQAEIRLDPPDLGPIEVRISRSDNETHLHFMVSHQATRDQLEQALPRLRELFGQGGLQLGQVEVEQGRREQLAQQPRESNPGSGKQRNEATGSDEVLTRRTTLMGLIDDYA